MMRTGVLGVCALAVSALFACPAQAQNLLDVKVTEPGKSGVSQELMIPWRKSTVVDVGTPIADIVLADPTVADVSVQTAQRMIFRGMNLGSTNALVFDRDGNQILDLEIVVAPDLDELNRVIARHAPEARVTAETVQGNVVLSGFANSVTEANLIETLASSYLVEGADNGSDGALINLMSIRHSEQVLLQVRIVEMQRNVAKRLGIDLSGTQVIDTNLVLGAATGTIVGAGEPTGVGSVAFNDPNTTAAAQIEALESVGIVRTLAEPNITALSGETGNFLAGGEFPVPVGETDDGSAVIEFQPFGVGLAFTPVILSEGRISLKIATEVSELSTEGAVTIGSTSIPSLSVRRAESTVELPSGRTMMMAGLIQATSRQELSKLPGIGDLPVLGTLFRGRDFAHDESELVVLITPYLVDPANPERFATPADGFVNPRDSATIFRGQLNRVYGRDGGAKLDENFSAPVGFIEE